MWKRMQQSARLGRAVIAADSAFSQDLVSIRAGVRVGAHRICRSERKASHVLPLDRSAAEGGRMSVRTLEQNRRLRRSARSRARLESANGGVV